MLIILASKIFSEALHTTTYRYQTDHRSLPSYMDNNLRLLFPVLLPPPWTGRHLSHLTHNSLSPLIHNFGSQVTSLLSALQLLLSFQVWSILSHTSDPNRCPVLSPRKSSLFCPQRCTVNLVINRRHRYPHSQISFSGKERKRPPEQCLTNPLN